MKKVSLFLIALFLSLPLIASDAIEPELLPMNEIFMDDHVNTKAAYEMLLSFRMYIRMFESDRERSEVLQDFFDGVDRALSKDPENSELWMLKGLCSEYYYTMGGKGIEAFSEEWHFYRAERDKAYQNALRFDGRENKSLDVGSLTEMLSRSGPEVGVAIAEKLISDHRDYYQYEQRAEIDVYSKMANYLIILGRYDEVERNNQYLLQNFPEKYHRKIRNVIESKKKQQAKFLAKQEEVGKLSGQAR